MTPIFAELRSSTGAAALTVTCLGQCGDAELDFDLLDLTDAEHDLARLRREAGELDRTV